MLTTDRLGANAAAPDSVTPASPEVPSFAFDPTDPWTDTFQKGLQRAQLQGKKAYEVGIGTGTNAAYLLNACGAAEVSGSDLDPRLIEIAESFVRTMAPQQATRFKPIRGSVSLIDSDEARAMAASADVIIGSLPQVGEPGDCRIEAIRESLDVPLADGAEQVADDHIAHYYPWADFDQYPFNSVGLGLNEALLDRVKTHAPQADVIMTFGCRIGADIIFDCFAAHGFTAEKLSSQIVKQHAGTDISFFVSLEKTLQGTGLDGDFRCRFFADKGANEPLSACEALQLVEENPNAALYHEVCAVRGVQGSTGL